MKVYKAWNGTLDKYGKGLYVFVVAENDEQALSMAKEAFSNRRSTTGSNSEAFIRMHAIIDDVSRPGTSGVWELPGEPYP